MSEIVIALKLGITLNNYRNLLNGKADIGTASKLGIITNSLQDFLNGKANIFIASKLGILNIDLQLILNNIGQKGAIGIIIGLLMRQSN